jgi:hypothetical protein
MQSFLRQACRRQAFTFAMLLLGLCVHARAGVVGVTISGAPPASIVVGKRYNFTPTLSGKYSGNPRFSIVNQPAWLSFSRSTGTLSGTPTASDVGVFSRIVITVSSSNDQVSLPAFSITVQQPAPPAPVLGSATLYWTPPLTNSDGTPLIDLEGFRVLYGADPSQLNQQLELPSPTLTTVRIEALTPGTYYFIVKAYNSAALESDASAVVWKTIM